VPVIEETTSPELVLVAPPEVAVQEREALASYELEYEQWLVQVRAAFAASAEEAEVPERRLTLGALAFTAFAAAASVTPLVLLILFR
jgi:hypothetical protein